MSVIEEIGSPPRDSAAGAPAVGDPSDTSGGSAERTITVRPEKLVDKDRGRRVRRTLPIHGYVGPNGSGKSNVMVHDTLPDLMAGLPVLSTVRLLNADTGEEYPNYIPWTDWEQAFEIKQGAILADEIVGIAGSRASSNLPVEVQNLLNQLRRGDIRFSWSAPAMQRADLIIRETSQGITVCKPVRIFAKAVPDPDSGRQRLWMQNRMTIARTYDAAELEKWTPESKKKVRQITKGTFWLPSARSSFSYDTYDAVTRVGGILDSGRCMSCGGVRRPKPCSCGVTHPVRRSPRD